MSQAFVFFAAIIVVIACIYLGVKLLGSVTSTGCDAARADFETSLKNVLDANAVYGSTNTAAIPIACDAMQLCFVDVASIPSASFKSGDPVITASVQRGVKANIFLAGSKSGTTDAGYDPRIIVNRDPSKQAVPGTNDIVCLNVTGGKFVFRTAGYGRFIGITAS